MFCLSHPGGGAPSAAARHFPAHTSRTYRQAVRARACSARTHAFERDAPAGVMCAAMRGGKRVTSVVGARRRGGFAAASRSSSWFTTRAMGDDDEDGENDDMEMFADDDDDDDDVEDRRVMGSGGVNVDADVDALLSSVTSSTTWGGDWPELVIFLARLQALGYSGVKLEGEDEDSERTTAPPEWARAVSSEPPKIASLGGGADDGDEVDLTPSDAGEVKRLVLAFCRDRPDLFSRLPDQLVYQLIDWPLPRKLNNRKVNAGLQRLRSAMGMDVNHLRGKCSACDKLSDRKPNPILQLSDFMRVLLALSEVEEPDEFPDLPSKDLASDALRRLMRIADSEKPAEEDMPKDTSRALPRSERNDREFRPRWDEDRRGGGGYGGRGGGRYGDDDRRGGRGGRGGRYGDRDRDFDRPPRRSFDRDDRPRFERRDDFGGGGRGRGRDFDDDRGFDRRPRFDRGDRDDFGGGGRGRGRFERDDFGGGGRGRGRFDRGDRDDRDGGGFDRRPPRVDRGDRDDFGGGRGRGRFDRGDRDDFGGGRGRGRFDRDDRPPRRSFDREDSARPPRYDFEGRDGGGRGRGRDFGGDRDRDRDGGGFERRERPRFDRGDRDDFGGGRGRGRFGDRDDFGGGRGRGRFDRGDRDDFGGGRGRGRFDRGDRDDFGGGRGRGRGSRGDFDRDRPPRGDFGSRFERRDDVSDWSAPPKPPGGDDVRVWRDE